MEIHKSAHSFYRLQYHVVWVCKYRRKILNPGLFWYIHRMLPELLKEVPGVEIETIGFDLEHMHMVMVIPPKYSISTVMGRLKSQSASALRKKYTCLVKVYWKENLV